jgi:hypothetical protein
MWGSKTPSLPDGERWYGDSEEEHGQWVYKPGLFDQCENMVPRPDQDESSAVVGCFVALGASAHKHGRSYISMTGPIDVTAIEANERFAAGVTEAKATFAKFAELLSMHGVTIEPPRFWLVEVEVR